MNAGHTMRAIGRSLPPDLVADAAGRWDTDCASCGWFFNPPERLYVSESLGAVFCSKGCAADAWERREPVEAGEWIPIKD